MYTLPVVLPKRYTAVKLYKKESSKGNEKCGWWPQPITIQSIDTNTHAAIDLAPSLCLVPRWHHLRLTSPRHLTSPLVYQTTASLGLAQVQLRSPKVVVATGAAARALKNGRTLPKIKSSSPIKHKHIRSLSHHLRAQSIKFGIGQVDV